MKRVTLWLGLALGALVLVAGTIIGANILRGEPESPETLRRPEPGETVPDYLSDGTPVFVVGHPDGSVDVLAAFDTHTPSNLGKLNWWCPTSRAIENPQHGSKWDEFGAKLDGPAPAGLRSWQVENRSTMVVLGPERPPPPLGTEPHGPPVTDREYCMGPDAASFHTFEGWRVWDSPTEAVAAAPDGWILLRGQLASDLPNNRVLFCAVAGCDDSVIAAGVEPVPPGMEFDPLAEGGRFIAWVRDGTLVELTRVIGE